MRLRRQRTGGPAPRFLDRSDSDGWQLVVPESLWAELRAHLFRSDMDEHGAVISAGIVRTERGIRLLARQLFCAIDGVDFVPAMHAHRRLTPEFVNRCIRHCRDERLAYLAVHNHGGQGAVEFSAPDLRSHERGYPALLDIGRGIPVGALVVAEGALAGDIWTPDRRRHPIGETVVISRNIERIYPKPTLAPSSDSEIDDRQVRIYGDAGQRVLRRLKVGVIGCGGVGMAAVSHLARLGVGHLVLVDPDKVELTNLPRLPEATRRDAMIWWTHTERAPILRGLGRALSSSKVRVGRRIARRARAGIVIDAIRADVTAPTAASHLVDCDYIFLAADSHSARAVFNALVHQYLVPGVQVGSLVEVDDNAALGAIWSVVRPVVPDSGCFWCNELIRPTQLTLETLPESTRIAQGYVPADDAPAPSVITLNARGVADATDRFMLAMTGMLLPSDAQWDYRRYETRHDVPRTDIPRRDHLCHDCGLAHSIRARGDTARLPVRL